MMMGEVPMAHTEILEELQEFTVPELLTVIEAALRLIREDPQRMEQPPTSMESERQLAVAAEALLPDYTEGGELTAFTVLDGEDFAVGELSMVNKFTAVFEQEGDWWIGYVEELPGANTQGATLEEARENLKEAIQLVIEANRELARRETEGRQVIREELLVTV